MSTLGTTDLQLRIDAKGSISSYGLDWAHRTVEVKLNPLGKLYTNCRPGQHLLGYDGEGDLTFQVTRANDEIKGWLDQPCMKARLGPLVRGPNLRLVEPPKG